MSRNGNGTYNLPAGNPVVTGTTVSVTWANNTLNDMATALTNSIAKDGQTTPTGNLKMGGYIHTNVGNANVRTDAGSSAQIQDNKFAYLTSVSGTDSISATAALGLTSYTIGQRFTFISVGENFGAATLDINAIGVKDITKNGTDPLVAGDIPADAAVEVVYDGVQFQLLNPATSVPAGVIMIWHDTLLTVPSGWYVCDGTNGTPDLSASFVTDGSNSYPYIMKA